MYQHLIFHQRGRDQMYKTWHTANGNQIIYTYSSGGSIVFADHIYPIQKGTLCFISSQCYHFTMPDQPAIYERSKILFSDQQLQSILQLESSHPAASLFSSKSAIYAHIPDEVQPEVEELYAQAARFEEFGPLGEFYFLTCVMRIIAYVNRYSLESLPAPSDFTAKCIGYINAHIAEPIHIDEICQAVNISKFHLCRRFKRATGLTVMEYVLKTRLTLAKNMLFNKNTTISEISRACGFSSLSYFCRVFQEEYGTSPMQYRKKSTQNNI